MKTTYIYRLIDPFTNETRYIGATQNIFKRYATHLCIRSDIPSPKREWIRALKAHGATPFIHVLEVFESEGYAHLAAEDRWIEHFQSKGQPLLNNPRRNTPRGISSRYVGVTRLNEQWIASIRHQGKRHSLGGFSTEIEAARAYDKASKELRGAGARLNFPTDQQQSA